MEQEIEKIETGLKNAFTGLPVHSIDLLVNTPTEWIDLMQPHRYKWIGGKLHRVTYDLGDNGKQILNEVPEPNGEFVDRLIPLEDLRAFMRPHMKDTLPPYKDEADESFQRGYRQCLYHLMEMLQINTCSSKKDRDLSNEIYSKKVY